MNDPLLQADDAATPLADEEREGLIPSYITLRGELNEAEQANILEAEEWAFGRHARLATDLLLAQLEQPRFTWGSASLVNAGETRKRYVAALRMADRHDMHPLLAFVRS